MVGQPAWSVKNRTLQVGEKTKGTVVFTLEENDCDQTALGLLVTDNNWSVGNGLMIPMGRICRWR